MRFKNLLLGGVNNAAPASLLIPLSRFKKKMMNKQIVFKYLFGILFIAFIVGAFCISKHIEKKENNRRLEARFDKFLGYLYPDFKYISYASNIYCRMQVSLMYDYLKNKRGRKIDEMVKYYDGGYFSMREMSHWELVLEQYRNMGVWRVFGPIMTAPPSRLKERLACYRIFWPIDELLYVNYYELDSNETVQNKEKIIDSLNMVIQCNFYSINRYRNISPKRDLNTIPDYEYDLNNY